MTSLVVLIVIAVRIEISLLLSSSWRSILLLILIITATIGRSSPSLLIIELAKEVFATILRLGTFFLSWWPLTTLLIVLGSSLVLS